MEAGILTLTYVLNYVLNYVSTYVSNYVETSIPGNENNPRSNEPRNINDTYNALVVDHDHAHRG